jgi:PKD repeat protein
MRIHSDRRHEVQAVVDLEDWGPGTSPIEFGWDFGDGTTQITRAQRVEYRRGGRPIGFRQSEKVEHTYAEPGRYTLRVRVAQGTRRSECQAPITLH